MNTSIAIEVKQWALSGMNLSEPLKATTVAAVMLADADKLLAATMAAAEALTPEGEEPQITQTAVLEGLRAISLGASK